MNELVTYQNKLPDTPRELSKFIAFSQERAKALEAEIRAIQRLALAEEVYKLKQAELAQLRCQMLLAYQQMGSFTKSLPTASAGRPGKEICSPGGTDFVKPKSQAIKDLGLSKAQVSRYEKIAAHPDVVDEVLSEAEAGQAEPTQAEVLRRIKEKESGNVVSLADAREQKRKEEDRQAVENNKNCKAFRKVVRLDNYIAITDAVLDSLVADEFTDVQFYINMLSDAIQALTDIRTRLILKGAKHGKKNHHAGN